VERLQPDRTLKSTDTAVTQVLLLKNNTNEPIFEVTLRDQLLGVGGLLVQEEVWALGTINPNEMIEIAYTFAFASNAPDGTYTLTSVLDNPRGTLTLAGNGQIQIETPATPTVLPTLTSTDDATETATSNFSFAARVAAFGWVDSAAETLQRPIITTALAQDSSLVAVTERSVALRVGDLLLMLLVATTGYYVLSRMRERLRLKR
jgi:hypothetical protein